jgi:hypothetical protein
LPYVVSAVARVHFVNTQAENVFYFWRECARTEGSGEKSCAERTKPIPDPVQHNKNNAGSGTQENMNTKTKNSRMIGGIAALGLALSLAPVTGHAQNGLPSSKVTAKTSRVTLIPQTTGTSGWQTVLANTIKTANQKDLFVGASLEVGLFTLTQAKSKNLQTDTSLAEADVQVRVLVDGVEAEPGPVVFGRRSQTLSATLEGAIAGCLTLVTNLDGSVSIVVDPDCVTPETIQLILDTLDAASFNFVAIDVPVGVHTVSVQARIQTTTSVESGTATAEAVVGKGTMTVESVRLIKDPNVILDVD